MIIYMLLGVYPYTFLAQDLKTQIKIKAYCQIMKMSKLSHQKQYYFL